MEHKVTCVLVMVLMLALSALAEDQTVPTLETCTVTPRERTNCGFPGVTASECAQKGCCFDDTIRGFPWCFHPKTIDPFPEDEECPF